MSAPAPSLTDRTVKGILWLGSGKMAYAAMQLLVLAILGRLLTPADFGLLGAALIVVAFSGILSQLGLGPALVQRAELEPRHVRTAWTGSILLGVVLGGVIWLTAPLAAAFFHSQQLESILRALALIFPLRSLGIVAESLACRDLQFRWLARLDVLAYSFGYGLVALPLALTGWGVWALVAGEIAESGFRAFLLLRRFRPPREYAVDRAALAELMYFGSGFTIAKVANFFAMRGDNILVGHLLGPSALGIYGRAYQLMSAPMATLGTILDQALFASMARVQSDMARVATAFRRGVTVMALIVLPVTGAVVLLAPETIRILLGPRWTEVIAPFQVLALGMLFQNNSKLSDSLARAMGAVYRRAWRQLLFASFVLTGSYIGQHWGVVGVAYGALGAISLNFGLMTHLSLRLTGLTWLKLVAAHLPGLRVAMVFSTVVWAVAAPLRSGGASPLIVVVSSLSVALACSMTLLWLRPTLLLGSDARWMFDMLQPLVPWAFHYHHSLPTESLKTNAESAGGVH